MALEFDTSTVKYGYIYEYVRVFFSSYSYSDNIIPVLSKIRTIILIKHCFLSSASLEDFILFHNKK